MILLRFCGRLVRRCWMIDGAGQHQLMDFNKMAHKTARKVERKRWTCSGCGRNVGKSAEVCSNPYCKTVFVN